MGRVALVTGATQGLGWALADGLARRLATEDVVYLTGRDRDRIDAAVAAVVQDGAQVRGELLDVARERDVAACAAELSARHGGVDLVFSNAYVRTLPGDDPAAVVDAYAETNNFGTTRMLRHVAPLLRGSGRFIVVASTLGTLHHLAPVLHDRFDDLADLDAVDASVRAWCTAVRDGTAAAGAWPAFLNIPSKIAQVAAMRTVARDRGADDRRHDRFLAAACPGMIDTGASRPWFDMSRAQTPEQAARPLLDLVLGAAPDEALYGELIRFGVVLPWKPCPATAPVWADS